MAVLLVGRDEGLDFFRGGVAEEIIAQNPADESRGFLRLADLEEIIAHTGMQINPHQHRLGGKLHQLNLAGIGLLHDELRS